MGQGGIPMLAETGISKLLEDLGSGAHGCADDIRRIAPEVLAGGPFTEISDIYSFACLGDGRYYSLSIKSQSK